MPAFRRIPQGPLAGERKLFGMHAVDGVAVELRTIAVDPAQKLEDVPGAQLRHGGHVGGRVAAPAVTQELCRA